MKLRILITLLFAKKFLLITGDDEKHVITNYTEREISRSGNALYF